MEQRMNGWSGRSVGILSLVFLIVILLVIPNFVLAEEVQVTHYVALGDSLTAGYEPWMQQEWEQKQQFPTAYGFVDRLYEQSLYHGRTELQNYGILGLTTTGLYHLLQDVEASKVVTASEIQADLPDPRVNDILAKVAEIRDSLINADLITITIGGNDFGDLYGLINEKTEADLQTIVAQRLQLYTENLSNSLKLIYQLNPDVKVVIADQYQPYPKIGNQAIYVRLAEFSTQLTTTLEKLIESMNMPEGQLQIAYVAKRFVSFEAAFTYINLLQPEKSDIHPNQRGYEEMAIAFTETIWGSYQSLTTKNPIGIVVKGKELKTPFKPVIINYTTYVPVREYVEALGGEVQWDQATQSAVAIFNGITVKYKLNSNQIDVNGKLVVMKDPVKLITMDPKDVNGKTYVPLRALAEDGLQLNVKYIQKSNTTYINP